MELFSRKRVKRRGILLDGPFDGSNHCCGCEADCCRGFSAVELNATEFSTLEKIGAKRLEFHLNGRFFLLIENGCEFLEGNRCGIYDERPAICRKFSCSTN